MNTEQVSQGMQYDSIEKGIQKRKISEDDEQKMINI